jgi:TerC family integral membrane protein
MLANLAGLIEYIYFYCFSIMSSIINRFTPHKEASSELPVAYDDGGSNKSAEAKSYYNAVVNTILNVLAAVAFGIGTIFFKGEQCGLEYFTAYLVEQSLSVDNLFVFIMLFNYFKVPLEFQNRVLTWGIIGAIVMRGIMITVGVAALKKFQWIILVFAGILIISAYKLLQEDDEEEDLHNNMILKYSKWLIKSSDEYDGEKFFTTMSVDNSGGKSELFASSDIASEPDFTMPPSAQSISQRKVVTVATPLLMCLICIEVSDLVFAIDSIPAVLGISHDSFVVFTSNVFAIMGLRSLYVLIAKAVADMPMLKPAVALVLGFVGGKMIGEYFKYELSIQFSLFVVLGILSGGVALSYIMITQHSLSSSFEKMIAVFTGSGKGKTGKIYPPPSAFPQPKVIYNHVSSSAAGVAGGCILPPLYKHDSLSV